MDALIGERTRFVNSEAVGHDRDWPARGEAASLPLDPPPLDGEDLDVVAEIRRSGGTSQVGRLRHRPRRPTLIERSFG
jgi:hypothetical protein